MSYLQIYNLVALELALYICVCVIRGSSFARQSIVWLTDRSCSGEAHRSEVLLSAVLSGSPAWRMSCMTCHITGGHRRPGRSNSGRRQGSKCEIGEGYEMQGLMPNESGRRNNERIGSVISHRCAPAQGTSWGRSDPRRVCPERWGLGDDVRGNRIKGEESVCLSGTDRTSRPVALCTEARSGGPEKGQSGRAVRRTESSKLRNPFQSPSKTWAGREGLYSQTRVS